MKKFFQDFKKFISRGNIIDLAIGVIIGNAFSAIVKALTDKIIMPLINWVLSFGGAMYLILEHFYFRFGLCFRLLLQKLVFYFQINCNK